MLRTPIDRNLRSVKFTYEYGLETSEITAGRRVANLGSRAGKRDPHDRKKTLSNFLGQ